MILTQAYSRVAGNEWPDDRAWLIAPNGKVFSCGFLHETCLGSNKELQPYLEEGDELVPQLLWKGWAKVGYFGDSSYLNIHSLTDTAIRAYQKLLKGFELGEKSTVQLITKTNTDVIPYKDFRWIDSVADLKKYARSGRFAAVKPTRAWMVSPQGKIHDCGHSHEKYIKENAKEFGGIDHPWDLMDQGWTRVGVLDKELYINPGQQLTASLLDLLQTFAMKVQVPYDKVEVGVPAGYVYFTKQEFPTISLKDINRRGPITYSSRRAAIEDHRGVPSEEREEGHHYYDIGHGDIGDPYYIWAWVDGMLDVRGPFDEENSATHGTLWGHDKTDLTYKGRYDEETGEVSVVVPDRWEHRELPSSLMARLEKRFNPTTIHLF